MFSELNSKVKTEGVSAMRALQEANGYSYEEVKLSNNRYLYLNLYDLVGVSEDVFGEGYTRSITDQRRSTPRKSPRRSPPLR